MSDENPCALYEASIDACGVTGKPCDKKGEEEINNCEIKINMYKDLA